MPVSLSMVIRNCFSTFIPNIPIKLQSVGKFQYHSLNISHPESPNVQLGDRDYRDLQHGAVSRDDCGRATGINGEV